MHIHNDKKNPGPRRRPRQPPGRCQPVHPLVEAAAAALSTEKHSMGRGFDAFLASKASKLARRRRDRVQIAKVHGEAARELRGRGEKAPGFHFGMWRQAPPEPLTELVAMQNPEKPGTWVWSPELAALLEKQEDHAPAQASCGFTRVHRGLHREWSRRSFTVIAQY